MKTKQFLLLFVLGLLLLFIPLLLRHLLGSHQTLLQGGVVGSQSGNTFSVNKIFFCTQSIDWKQLNVMYKRSGY